MKPLTPAPDLLPLRMVCVCVCVISLTFHHAVTFLCSLIIRILARAVHVHVHVIPHLSGGVKWWRYGVKCQVPH